MFHSFGRAKVENPPARSEKGDLGKEKPAPDEADPVSLAEILSARESVLPLFLRGDSLEVLRGMPANSFDFAMTSPPYWGQREYTDEGIGLESTSVEYIQNLLAIVAEVHRVLKKCGSFWLNLGDAYVGKGLQMIPQRVATAMIENQGWILRNSVVWNKVKGGPDNAKDKLRNIHEPLFHFVKTQRGYYYDVDAIRKRPR